MSTHTAIATTSKGIIDAIQVPTTKPGPGEILLKNAFSSMIAFDTYMADLGYAVQEYPAILGFNASGTVAEVGPGVTDLAVGDRITAFAYQNTQAKAMQQFSILPIASCAKIPDSLSLDAAVTIPDNFVTAYWSLFDNMKLPRPSELPSTYPPPLANTPILVYGAGATSGQYAIQLLKLAGYKNILTTASPRHHELLRRLGATHIFDYSSTDLTDQVLKAAGGKVPLVLDCITAESTLAAMVDIISSDGTIALLLPIKEGNSVRGAAGTEMAMELAHEKNPFPKSVNVVGVRTFLYQTNDYFRDNLMPRILPELLVAGHIEANHVHLLDQGTLKERVEVGLDLLRHNKVSGEKVVVKID